MRRRTLFLCALIALSGCAGLPQEHVFERSGRFSLRAERSGKSETVSGRWRLSEENHRVELTLMTPLYGILARISAGPEGATLERPGKQQNAMESAPSAEELMQRHLGFGLPAEMLSSWLRAKPWEGAPAEMTAAGFVQSGWQIAVKRRKEDGSLALLGVTHPETAQQAAVSLNLVID